MVKEQHHNKTQMQTWVYAILRKEFRHPCYALVPSTSIAMFWEPLSWPQVYITSHLPIIIEKMLEVLQSSYVHMKTTSNSAL